MKITVSNSGNGAKRLKRIARLEQSERAQKILQNEKNLINPRRIIFY